MIRNSINDNHNDARCRRLIYSSITGRYRIVILLLVMIIGVIAYYANIYWLGIVLTALATFSVISYMLPDPARLPDPRLIASKLDEKYGLKEWYCLGNRFPFVGQLKNNLWVIIENRMPIQVILLTPEKTSLSNGVPEAKPKISFIEKDTEKTTSILGEEKKRSIITKGKIQALIPIKKYKNTYYKIVGLGVRLSLKTKKITEKQIESLIDLVERQISNKGLTQGFLTEI